MLDYLQDSRAQQRAALKLQLAKLQAKSGTVREGDQVIAKLEASKDTATSEHAEVAARIQNCLDALDQDDIAEIVAGRSPTDESLKRRRELLNELTEVNSALELKLEAARRSIATQKSQIEQTRIDCCQLGTIEANLRRTCSVRTRQAMLANEFRVSGLKQTLGEIGRRLALHQEHIDVHKRNQDTSSPDAVFASQRFDDLSAVQTQIQTEFDEALREQNRLAQLAVDE
ncbi:MAG: hypothetical protein U0941_19340 [Planctomycetaceae bacterium]